MQQQKVKLEVDDVYSEEGDEESALNQSGLSDPSGTKAASKGKKAIRGQYKNNQSASLNPCSF